MNSDRELGLVGCGVDHPLGIASIMPIVFLLFVGGTCLLDFGCTRLVILLMDQCS